jgi:hypothetical protein
MERDHLEDVGGDGRIILKLILKSAIGWHGLGCPGSGQGNLTGACECGKEPSHSVICGDFLA